MKIVSIHQPCYVPYLGLFYKIANSDCFVFLDDAQFSKGNVQDCNRIKTAKSIQKLKIPVEYRFGNPINQVRTKDELGWKEKHLNIIKNNYSETPYFGEFFPILQELLSKDYNSLSETNIAIIDKICSLCGINTKFYQSSRLNAGGKREAKVINICKELEADIYLSGTGAKVYQEEEHFLKEGIKLVYSKYEPFHYPQQYGEFAQNLSVIDYIFNCGYDLEFCKGGYKNG